MRKIAVTGSSGMIGRHMIALLRSEGIADLCLTRDEWDLADWKEFDELDALFDGVGAVFHFGAALPKNVSTSSNRFTQEIFDVNVRSCLNLAEWGSSRNVPLVFLSGATVYENPHGPKIDETSLKVENGFGGFYGYSKLLAEGVIQYYVKEKLNSIILRPSSVYGYGMADNKLVQNYLNQAFSNETLKIDQPHNKINLIHALDVAKAALQAYQSGSWGVYNIAAERTSSILEVAETAIKINKGGVLELSDDARLGDGFVRFDLDFSKASDTFSFFPSISLQEGMSLMSLRREL